MKMINQASWHKSKWLSRNFLCPKANMMLHGLLLEEGYLEDSVVAAIIVRHGHKE